MEFKKIKITNLNHADYNPRKDLKPGDSEYDKIKRSIQEFGYVEPVIVNKHGCEEGYYLIVGGHQRTKVLKDAGAMVILGMVNPSACPIKPDAKPRLTSEVSDKDGRTIYAKNSLDSLNGNILPFLSVNTSSSIRKYSERFSTFRNAN